MSDPVSGATDTGSKTGHGLVTVLGAMRHAHPGILLAAGSGVPLLNKLSCWNWQVLRLSADQIAYSVGRRLDGLATSID